MNTFIKAFSINPYNGSLEKLVEEANNHAMTNELDIVSAVPSEHKSMIYLTVVYRKCIA